MKATWEILCPWQGHIAQTTKREKKRGGVGRHHGQGEVGRSINGSEMGGKKEMRFERNSQGGSERLATLLRKG